MLGFGGFSSDQLKTAVQRLRRVLEEDVLRQTPPRLTGYAIPMAGSPSPGGT